jgi:hypothetical protein
LYCKIQATFYYDGNWEYGHKVGKGIGKYFVKDINKNNPEEVSKADIYEGEYVDGSNYGFGMIYNSSGFINFSIIVYIIGHWIWKGLFNVSERENIAVVREKEYDGGIFNRQKDRFGIYTQEKSFLFVYFSIDFII